MTTAEEVRKKLSTGGIDFAASTGLTEKQAAGLKKIAFRSSIFAKVAPSGRVTTLTESQEHFRQRVE